MATKKTTEKRLKRCVICRKSNRMSKDAKTCSYSCAAKLAWETMRAEGTR